MKSRLSRDINQSKNPYDERQAYDNYLNNANPPYETYRNKEECREIKQEYGSSYKNTGNQF